jgi:hypothetical protein
MNIYGKESVYGYASGEAWNVISCFGSVGTRGHAVVCIGLGSSCCNEYSPGLGCADGCHVLQWTFGQTSGTTLCQETLQSDHGHCPKLFATTPTNQSVTRSNVIYHAINNSNDAHIVYSTEGAVANEPFQGRMQLLRVEDVIPAPFSNRPVLYCTIHE